MTKNQRGKGRLSLLSGVSLLAAATMTLCGATTAYAQDTQDEASTQSGEEIVVVGSRIRRDNFNAPSPIQVITREESARAGLASTTEVLQSSTVTSGGGQLNNLFGGFVVNGGTGVNTLGLRGFGPTQTLVLVNGRRLSPAGVRGAVGAADLNVLPSAMVERVEILKDGASSVYGSDAVAGVVNIITNENLQGFVLEAQRNIVEGGGGDQSRISLSFGHTMDNFKFTGSAEYYERESLTYGQRDYTACPRDLARDPSTGESLDDVNPVTNTLNCWSIEFQNSPGTTINTIGTARRPGFGGPGNPTTGNFNRWRPNPFVGDGTPASGTNFLDGFEGVNGGGNLNGFGNRDTFDPAMLDQELVTPVRTGNVFLQAEYDLDSHNQVYGEFLYSTRRSSGKGYIQLTLDYPNNELLPAELRLGGVQNPLTTLPATLPTNVPIPDPYATQVRAFIGFGNTQSTQEVDYTRYVVGARGDLQFLDGWRYDVNLYYGKNDSLQIQPNFLVDRIFNSLVVTADPAAVAAAPADLVRSAYGNDVVCQITVTNPGYGCIPAPALTASTIGGRLPSEWVNWVQQSLPETNVYKETAFQAIFDGPLFALPAGDLQAVFGFEHRKATIDDTPDFNNVNFNIYNFTSALPTRGEDSVNEAFTELEAPLLRDQALARSLTLNVSGRYTDYKSYGAGKTYKIGLTWEPIDDLMVRYTRGTSFRAPALFEQFLGAQSGFQPGGFDPCNGYGGVDPSDPLFINCDAQIHNPNFIQNNGVTIFAIGGAANHLKAETSKNETIGFTWHPLQNRDGSGDLSMAIDRFSIAVDNEVAQYGARNILQICYNDPNFSTQPLCSLVNRDSSNNVTVNNSYLNIAAQEAEGYDIGVRYIHALLGGDFKVDLNLVKFTSQSFQLSSLFDPQDTNGLIGSPEMAGDLTLHYETGPWHLRYGVTWIKSMDDNAFNGLCDPVADPDNCFALPQDNIFQFKTPDYYLSDVSAEYSHDDWRVIVGVRNLFDKTPPLIGADDFNINALGSVPFYSGFDYFGRQFFVNVSTKF